MSPGPIALSLLAFGSAPEDALEETAEYPRVVRKTIIDC